MTDAGATMPHVERDAMTALLLITVLIALFILAGNADERDRQAQDDGELVPYDWATQPSPCDEGQPTEGTGR